MSTTYIQLNKRRVSRNNINFVYFFVIFPTTITSFPFFNYSCSPVLTVNKTLSGMWFYGFLTVFFSFVSNPVVGRTLDDKIRTVEFLFPLSSLLLLLLLLFGIPVAAAGFGRLNMFVFSSFSDVPERLPLIYELLSSNFNRSIKLLLARAFKRERIKK